MSGIFEASWAKICKIVFLFIIDVLLEHWFVLWVLNHVLQIKIPGFKVHWKKCIRVQIHPVKAWWFALKGGHGANNIVHADWLMVEDVVLDLPLLLMDVTGELPSNNILVPIHKSVVSSAIGPQALVNIWDMADNDGATSNLLKTRELLIKPF